MKKFLKTFFITLFALILFSLGKNVFASSIDKISMDIYVDSSGDAHVTEVWDCYPTQGTEVYHPYYNLGNSVIKDLTVSEDNNTYTSLSSWNTSGSLSSKANKCGINKISNGVELCWGIGSYGSHTYTVEYIITNFVAELSDSQMIYWTLIPYDFSNPIGSVYIKIYTDSPIADDIDVWGYGNYGGTAYVYDGYIEMQSDGRLASSEYMTILVKFPLGTFNTTNELDYDFNHYLDMAQEGATSYKGSGLSSSSGPLGFRAILYPILNFLPYIIFLVIGIGSSIMGYHKSDASFDKEGKKLIRRSDSYYRDIPCNKDIYRAYCIGSLYGIIRNKTDLLGAVILKWLKDGLIRVEKRESGGVFSRENSVVVLNECNPDVITLPKERELFDMLYQASKDGILEGKELEKWCKNHYSKILSWFDIMYAHEKKKLKEQGLIQNAKGKFLGIISYKYLVSTPELREEASNLAGLKRYLNDYSLIHDREAIEVNLFEEYLIFAQIMGIAKKVAKQFKDLYPTVIEESHFDSYDTFMFIHTCSYNGISQASAAQSRAESYSSGGGGFSSGGGGGGSFGGGGGGGGFR